MPDFVVHHEELLTCLEESWIRMLCSQVLLKLWYGRIYHLSYRIRN